MAKVEQRHRDAAERRMRTVLPLEKGYTRADWHQSGMDEYAQGCADTEVAVINDVIALARREAATAEAEGADQDGETRHAWLGEAEGLRRFARALHSGSWRRESAVGPTMPEDQWELLGRHTLSGPLRIVGWCVWKSKTSDTHAVRTFIHTVTAEDGQTPMTQYSGAYKCDGADGVEDIVRAALVEALTHEVDEFLGNDPHGAVK